MFELTQGQEAARKMLQRMQDDQAPFGVVTGFAGTGKTTLIKILAEVNQEAPIVLAPTGKAALRVREATDLEASTIHRWLYKPVTNPKTGDVDYQLRSPQELPLEKLIVIDEGSMVGSRIWADLMQVAPAIDATVLVLGDTFQLPPVAPRGEEPFSVLTLPTPHRVHMTDIVRQALDNPIIRASMMIRERKSWDDVAGLLNVVEGDEFENAQRIHEGGGATIVYTNDFRHQINARLRARLGLAEGTLEQNEPLLVLKNNYGLDVYNGEIVKFEGWTVDPTSSVYARDTGGATPKVKEMALGVGVVEGVPVMLSPTQVSGAADAIKPYFIEIAARTHWSNSLRARANWAPDAKTPPYIHANYGYALTCHKAQGSEWDEILVLVESKVRPDDQGRRWLYTAVTRAKKTCNIAFAL